MSDDKPTGGAARVFGGILLSRLIGFVRDRVIAHYFGLGIHADVFRTALRGPNILQNLLGEGTVSAAFIPIYSRLLEQGRERDAGRLAGAVLGLLLAVAATVSLVGLLLADPIVRLLAPGYVGDARFELTVQAVRIIFPMTGLLVLAAWALGVLNSHRRFFLPYFAPVLWNLCIIAAVTGTALWRGGDADELLRAACLGALAGGLLQFLVQLPLVFREMSGFKLSFSRRVEGVGEALSAVGPAIAGRGVYQLSAYIDLVLASFLAFGAPAALGYAQTLYLLPVSLFGLSVAAAELPELSRRGDGDLGGEFAERLGRSRRKMGFFTVPTAVGYLAFGLLLVGAVYRTGSFGVEENWLVYLVLGGYTLGLLATTTSRLMQNAFFALKDTRTPARVAVIRLVLSAGLGLPLMLWLDAVPVARLIPGGGDDQLKLGALGLALASAVAAWTELTVLRAQLRRRTGPAPADRSLVAMLGVALLAAAPAAALWWVLPELHVALAAALVIGLYAAVYLGVTQALGLSQLRAWLGR